MINLYFFNKKPPGFTLIELLVATAILGFLAIVSAVIVSSVIKSQNKTEIINEVRGNGDLVIAKFERDVKGASLITRNTARRVTLDYEAAPQVVWRCDIGFNFRRNADIINTTDPIRGVQLLANPNPVCDFQVTPKTPNTPQIVTLQFSLIQRSTTQRQEFQ